MNTTIGQLITENAATHSNLIKKLKISRATYYKKLDNPQLFTDFELRQIAKNSTIDYRVLKSLVKDCSI